MNIRKYTLISIGIIIIALLIIIVSYQKYYSFKMNEEAEEQDGYSRIVKTDSKEIMIYKKGDWKNIEIKGVELSSFRPGYGRYKSKISKSEVTKWLEQIGDLNANLIKVPYIQPPGFYSAIYDYNLNREEPIYIMHEIMLDERNMLKNYNVFDGEIIKNFKKDIRKTIKVIHGQSLILSNKRSHTGLYLKDISKYNLGFILGTNINPEIITLTNASNEDEKQYEGSNFSTSDASPFEVFIAQMLDYASEYEIKRYDRVGLLSFLTTVDTDALEYKHESNATKHANININKIEDKGKNNLFVSYKFHPNSVDFLDYEYEYDSSDGNVDRKNETVFLKQLNRINQFYKLPLIISDTGISSSRGISKIDSSDGYHRGGFSEEDQGLMLIKLLEDIDKSNSSGVLINSWQDNWTNLTSSSMLEDYLDESASSYWHDSQSSDENFGLLKFESGKEKDKTYIDGEFSDWARTDYLLDEKDIKLKVKADGENLYMLIEKKDWSLNKDKLYLGIDVTPLSGSKIWKDEAEFDTFADFVVNLDGYNESRIVVNERYNIFDYLYKYYTNIIEKQDKIPGKNSDSFNAIYLLNRKSVNLKNSSNPIPPVYYQTGDMIHGNNNPKSEEFDSLADFNKKEDTTEIKIPWTVLNFKNPLDDMVYSDFYLDGVNGSLKIKDLGFSINFKNSKEEIVSKEVRYNMERFKSIDYFERLKGSYYILKDYWEKNPKTD